MINNLDYRLKLTSRENVFRLTMEILNPSGEWVYYDHRIYVAITETYKTAKRNLIQGACKCFGVDANESKVQY